LIGRSVEQLPRLGWGVGVGHLDVVASLDGAQVLAQLVLGQEQLIAHPQGGAFLTGEQAALVPHLDHRILGRPLWLAIEQVGDRGHRVDLEWLIGIELKLHKPFISKDLYRKTGTELADRA